MLPKHSCVPVCECVLAWFWHFDRFAFGTHAMRTQTITQIDWSFDVSLRVCLCKNDYWFGQSLYKAIKFHSTKCNPNTHPTILHKKPSVQYAFFCLYTNRYDNDETLQQGKSDNPCNKIIKCSWLLGYHFVFNKLPQNHMQVQVMALPGQVWTWRIDTLSLMANYFLNQLGDPATQDITIDK